MTSGQQRSNRSTLKEKETIVHVVAGCKSYDEMLGMIPALSSCSSEVLEAFASRGEARQNFAAGETLWTQTSGDEGLYVVVTGSAVLDTDDGISVVLESGDYFGGPSGSRFGLNASVFALEDLEVLIVHPQELSQLKRASSRSRHPSNIEWRSELPVPSTRFARRRARHSVLAG